MPEGEKFTVQVPFTFDEQFIEDVLTTAFEGGCSHWLVGIETAIDKGGRYHQEDVAKDGAVRLFVDDETGYRVFGRADFLRGFQMYLAWGFEKSRPVYTDAGNIDAIEADVIVQMAVFGEIVYD